MFRLLMCVYNEEQFLGARTTDVRLLIVHVFSNIFGGTIRYIFQKEKYENEHFSIKSADILLY